MRVLGIDPGSSVTGYGVVDQHDKKLFYVGSGDISTHSKMSFPDALKKIYNELAQVIRVHSPEMVAIESLFFHKNVKAALKLGHVRGVLILAAVNAGVAVYEYSPMEIKQAVVGYGRATKDQTQKMVKQLLTLSNNNASSDASDALAVAICHIHSFETKKALKLSK